MPDRIVVADGVQHIFPADATDQEISDALNGPKAQGWSSSLASIASPAGLEGLKQYGKELISGEGTARAAVSDYGKKEGGAFLSTLNPVNQVKGVLRMVAHPIDTASGMVDTAKSALEGDPQAVGSVLGAVVAPKADAAVLRGVNTASTALANSPAAQRGAGYISGAGFGIAGGAHPFIMARVGQALAPVIGGAARGVSNVTGKMMDTLGMSEPSPIDRYAPNTSGYSIPDPREMPVAPDTAPLPRGIPQGVYAQLPDGSWGVQALAGHKLIPGETVNVMNRAGQAAVHTVGKIGPYGIASIGGAETPLPSGPISFHGSRVTDPAVLEAVMKRLRGE